MCGAVVCMCGVGQQEEEGHREMAAAQYQINVRLLCMLHDLLFVLSQSTFPSIYALCSYGLPICFDVGR